MRLHNAAPLVLVAALAQSVSAAVIWDITNRQATARLPQNATTIATPTEGTTQSLTLSISTEDASPSSISIATREASSSSPISDELEQSTSSTTTSISHTTTSAVDHDTSLSVSHAPPKPPSSSVVSTALGSLTTSISTSGPRPGTTSITINSTPAETEDSRQISANQETRPPSAPSYSATIPRANTTSQLYSTTRGLYSTGTFGSITTPSYNVSVSSTISSWNVTQSHGSTRTTSAAQSDTCTVLQGDEPMTVYSIVFTATVTIYGNNSAYTPPYPTIETPNYCGTMSTAPVLTSGPMLSSIGGGFVTASKERPTSCSNSACFAGAGPDDDSEPSDSNRPKEGGATTQSTQRMTVTFVTTDKNPSVVFPSEPVPAFSQSGKAGSLTAQQHKSVPLGGSSQDDPQSLQQEPQSTSTFTITARAEQVIINDQTFSNLEPEQTTIVTVSGGTFTILPTAVVGEGATVEKPQPIATAITVLTATTGSLGGLPVTISGSEAAIDGTKVDIPPLGTTITVHGEAVSVGPGKVVVDGETMTFRAVGGYQTDVVVNGGEMITAVGQSIFVFHSTTLTYGPGIPETSEVVDDDTITIGPSGIVMDSTTIGGTLADANATTYEIIGGATITKVSPSFVIIDGTAFTAGPKASKVVKVIGGETITIGSDGVIISSMTLKYPFGSSTVTTFKASATGADTLPTETGRTSDTGDDIEEENAGYLLQPDLTAGIAGLCIAIGVWVWL